MSEETVPVAPPNSEDARAVARLTKSQYAKAAEIRYLHDLSRAVMQEMIAVIHDTYEQKRMKISAMETELWQELYAAFGLDPGAVYAIDSASQSIVMQAASPKPDQS